MHSIRDPRLAAILFATRTALGVGLLLGAAACSSPAQTAAAGRATCDNGVVDGPESDVDCGGTCDLCATGLVCRVGTDCFSGACEGGFCLADAPTCTDQRKNGPETGVDCGGTCPGCAAGQPCNALTDCRSGVCTDHLCDESATCSDAALSPGESDLDCGGPCTACATGLKCRVPGDCLSATCIFGICRDPSCTDAVLNGGESDTDCGGPCDDCVDGERCAVPDDCASVQCSGAVCVSCEDEIRNGAESDRDCGGSHCPDCSDGAACGQSEDCTSGRCADGRCSSCTDGAKNGAETGVDCGGGCVACLDGIACGVGGDCASGRCSDAGGAKTCTSCTDHLKNGGETDPDCGGPCGPCALGGHCGVADDCGAGICEGGVCCTPNLCGHCGASPTETCNGKDDDCDGGTDEAAEIGQAPTCGEQRGVCAGSRASCRGLAGWTCQASDFASHSSHYQGTESTCDARDNDCDGATDEGLLNACGQCGALPVETCNGKDDDCDGGTDEGVKNACGKCGPEPFEICNGVDDDCDSKTDEWFGCAECSATPVKRTVVHGWGDPAVTTFGAPVHAMAASGTEVWFAPGWVQEQPATKVFRLRPGAAAEEITLPHAFGYNIALAGEGETFGVVGSDASFANDVTLLQCAANGTACTESTAYLPGPSWSPVDARLAVRGGVWHCLAETYREGPTLLYMTFANGAWSEPTVVFEGGTIYRFDLDVDGAGRPVVAWSHSNDEGAIQVRIGTAATARIASTSFIDFSVAGTPDGRAIVLAPVIGGDGLWFLNSGIGTAFSAGAPAVPIRHGARSTMALDPQGRVVMGDVGSLDADWRTTTGAIVWSSSGTSGAAWNSAELDRMEDVSNRYFQNAYAVSDALGRLHGVVETNDRDVYRYDYDATMVCPGFVSCGPTCGKEPNPDGTSVGPVPDPPSGIVVNEVLYDTVGADDDVFVEIKGPPGTSLAGWSLVGINGGDGATYKTVALSGTIPASGYYLVVDTAANATLKASAQLVAGVDFQNGPDSVQLRNGASIVDAVAYGTFGAGTTQAGEGSPEPAPAAAGASIARSPDGADTNQNASDFASDATPSPGAANGP